MVVCFYGKVNVKKRKEDKKRIKEKADRARLRLVGYLIV